VALFCPRCAEPHPVFVELLEGDLPAKLLVAGPWGRAVFLLSAKEDLGLEGGISIPVYRVPPPPAAHSPRDGGEC
jgi:hypothetical protein